MLDLASICVAALAYLLGSIPTAYIVGRRLRGIDIRSVGSGNPGAANATMQLGKRAGAFVLAVDAGKGIIAILIGQRLGVSDTTLYISAFLAVVGHNFSPFVGLRGGKGAATALGISVLMLWEITAISGAVGRPDWRCGAAHRLGNGGRVHNAERAHNRNRAAARSNRTLRHAIAASGGDAPMARAGCADGGDSQARLAGVYARSVGAPRYCLCRIQRKGAGAQSGALLDSGRIHSLG